LRAAAHRVVIDHITPGIDATHSHTGIGTLEVDTGQAGGTLTVDDTLWSTVRRSTIVTWKT